MTEINGIRVDEAALARGLYALLPDEYRAALAFGMLPEPIFEALRRLLGEKYDEIAGLPHQQALEAFEEFGSAGEDVVADLKASYTATRKQFVREAERVVALAMYRVAPMVV